jgi:sugar lactone lactonase YvrE
VIALKTLMTGLAFPESPRWHEDRLWFSDWGAHEVIALDLEGKSEVVVSSLWSPDLLQQFLVGRPLLQRLPQLDNGLLGW